MTTNLRYFMNTSQKHNVRGLVLQYKLFKNLMAIGWFQIDLVLFLKRVLNYRCKGKDWQKKRIRGITRSYSFKKVGHFITNKARGKK